jgi:hypothetical protein
VLRHPLTLFGLNWELERMKAYALTLRVLAALIMLIAVLHGVLAHGAEVLLGVPVPTSTMADASQDSQNRFFGLAFALYAVVFIFVAGDVRRYFGLLGATFLVFFVAGLGRIVSIVAHGLPAAPIIGLAAIELVAPPLLYLWGRKVIYSA